MPSQNAIPLPESPSPVPGSYASSPGEYGQAISLNIAQKIMATTIGNCATLLICGLIYLNYVLFESYIGVFLYAFLASEALWDTKCMLVRWLKRVNDEDNDISLRAELHNWTSAHSLGGWVTWVSVAMFSIGLATYPVFCLYVTVIIVFFMAVTYVFDRKVLFLFQIHRWFLDDDTLIALVLIILVFFTGAFLAASFTLLVLRDVKLAIDLIASSFEDNNYLTEWVQDVLQGVSRDGKNALDHYVDVIEEQYLQNSSWAPLLRWSLQYVDNLTTSMGPLEHRETPETWANKITMIVQDPWSVLPHWPRGKVIQSIRQLVVELSSSNEEVLGPLSHLSGYLKENLFGLAGMGISIAFLIVDFGVRLVFFITILMILLSSKDAVLHEFLGGFTESGVAGQSTMFEIQLRNAIEAVLLMPIKMSLLNALATLGIYWMFGMKLMFFAASLSLLFTIFPVISPFWICLPWITVYYAYNYWSLSWSIFVFSVNYTIFYYVNMWVLAGFGNRFPRPTRYEEFEEDNDEYQAEGNDSEESEKEERKRLHWSASWFAEITEPELVGKREYITGLSVFFGITAFGAKGALLGPLVVCLALVTYNVIRDHQQTVYREQQQVLVSPTSPNFPITSRRQSSFVNTSERFSPQPSAEFENHTDGEEEELKYENPAPPLGRIRRHNSYSSAEANGIGTAAVASDITRSSLNLIGDLFGMSPARPIVQRTHLHEDTSIHGFQRKLSSIKTLRDEELITNEQFKEIRRNIIDNYLQGEKKAEKRYFRYKGYRNSDVGLSNYDEAPNRRRSNFKKPFNSKLDSSRQ